MGAALDPWPGLRDEIEGMAAGARQDPLALLAINARTELLAGAGVEGECSVIGVLAGDRVRLAQTWDWHPDLAPAVVVATHAPGDGPGFRTVTEAGILAKLGLNTAGVAVGLNFLTAAQDGGLDGTPVHVLLRLVLERCHTALDALKLLTTARTSASSCVTVAAAEPEGASLFAVELSPGGAAVVWPDEEGVLVHTNHFLRPPATIRDLQPRMFPGTLLRRDHLLRALRAGVAPAAALRAHVPRPEPVCRHVDESAPWAERRASLLATEIDPVAGAFRVAPGLPCSTPAEPVPS